MSAKRSHTHVKDHEVHVRVQWIVETPNWPSMLWKCPSLQNVGSWTLYRKRGRRRIHTLLSQHWCRWGDAWLPEECWCQPSSAGPCAPWSAGPGSCGWSRCTWTWGHSHCNKTLCMHDMKVGRAINIIMPLSSNNHFCNSKDDQTVMRWWEDVKERMRSQELFNSKTDIKIVVVGNNNSQQQNLLFKQMSQAQHCKMEIQSFFVISPAKPDNEKLLFKQTSSAQNHKMEIQSFFNISPEKPDNEVNYLKCAYLGGTTLW